MIEYLKRLYDDGMLYRYLEKFAADGNLTETAAALPFAKKCHEGQLRDSRGNIPYIVHPLQIAVHAISLGLCEDYFLAAALLHDVCEDCGVLPSQLPVGEKARNIVVLVTKDWEPHTDDEEREKAYYQAISQNPSAAMLKILDRCNNISSMSVGLSSKRIKRYLEETERYYDPLIKLMTEEYPAFRLPVYAAAYQIHSVCEALERMLKEQKS